MTTTVKASEREALLREQIKMLQQQIQDMNDEFDNLSKNYWLLISEFRVHLEQDAKEKH